MKKYYSSAKMNASSGLNNTFCQSKLLEVDISVMLTPVSVILTPCTGNDSKNTIG